MQETRHSRVLGNCSGDSRASGGTAPASYDNTRQHLTAPDQVNINACAAMDLPRLYTLGV